MKQFAKLYLINEHQILVRLNINRETDKTELITTTWYKGSQVEVTIGEFEQKGGTAMEAFERVDESGAEQFLELVKQLSITD